MNKNPETNQDDNQPDSTRRQLGMGLLAVLGGGLGMVQTAEAFPRGTAARFAAASRILAPFGVSVSGKVDRNTVPAHDVLTLQVVPLDGTEYTEIVGTLDRLGEIIPCIKTSIFDDDVNFSHFHPGQLVPCVKTTISDTLATHELFDADQGGIIPCVRVESEMLDGGHLGTIVATHFHPGAIVPCVKTTISDTLATHELFDADQGGIEPCWRAESEMLDGGHIGTIVATHFHPTAGGMEPCIRATIDGHRLATYELLEANERGQAVPTFTLATQMLEGGALGAVEVTIDNPNLPLRLQIGGNTYLLVEGELVLERPVVS